MLLAFMTTALIVGFSMSAMALGAILRGRPLRHGCGEATACEWCRRPCADRESEEEGTWNGP